MSKTDLHLNNIINKYHNQVYIKIEYSKESHGAYQSSSPIWFDS